MTFSTLDEIVRNWLMQRRYPLHYYIEALVYAKDCLRQLSMDDLHMVNTRLLPVNSYNAITLPEDYLDYTRVAIEAGQYMKPLVEDNTINPLYKYNSDFEVETYQSAGQANDSENVYYGSLFPMFWRTVTWNQWGESIGRMFGWRGNYTDTFKVVKTRGEIQLNESISADNILLEYISDGKSADAATRVDSYAYDTIDAYISWKFKENNRTYGIGERQLAEQEYIGQRRILRARLSNLTIEKMKRIVQGASYASPK